MPQFDSLVFSGVQPTGNLQLGNYLGAIKRWVELQNQFDCIYCIVDMHALTVNPAPLELINNTRQVTATLIAAGIDPEKHIVFNQSRVYQHAELAWVFNCIARIGWMNRMTQFKDKAGRNSENVSLGLFAYPSLMAADILIYRATHVPVGEDQKQHLELTRDIAQKFNNDYAHRIEDLGINKSINSGEKNVKGFFPLVEPIIEQSSMRIMSLRDGSKKMSKSDPSDYSRINLSDTSDNIVMKIKKAKTDSEPLPYTLEELEKRLEANNLVGIYASLADMEKQQVLDQFGGQQFSVFKPALADLAVAMLEPISLKLREINQDISYIDSLLKRGAERASIRAEKTMKHVRDIVGFL